MGKAYRFIKMVEFMRDSLRRTRNVDMDVSFMQMEIYTLVISKKTKSMEKVHSIGLVSVSQHAQKINSPRSNSIMDNGGVDFLMGKGNIQKQMVNKI